MRCLKDYVGLREGCTFAPSVSGLYLNQLPGITIEKMDDVASEDQVTYKQLWDDIQETTIHTFREDVIAEFDRRYLLKQVTQTIDLDQEYDTTVLTPPAVNTQYGLLIESSQADDSCTCSNLQHIYIQSLSFFYSGANPSPSFTVNVFDRDLGTNLYTATVNATSATPAVAGWNTINIEQTFNTRGVYVFVLGNFDNYVNLDLSLFNLDNFGTFTNGSGWGYNSANQYLYFNWGGCGCQSRVRGATVAGSQWGNPNTGTNAYGVSVVFSTKCSFDNVVCLDKRHFASAWQVLLAIEFLNYVEHTPRTNRWTTIDRDQSVQLRRLLTMKYRGGKDTNSGIMYPGKLPVAVNGIELDSYDCCLKANDHYIWAETIP